jgi:hypothetical protein
VSVRDPARIGEDMGCLAGRSLWREIRVFLDGSGRVADGDGALSQVGGWVALIEPLMEMG